MDTIIKYNLQFFAKDGPGGEKTEPATTKKLDDARKEGQIAKSKEIITAVFLLSLFLVIKVYVSSLGAQFVDSFKEIYQLFGRATENTYEGLAFDTATGALQIVLMDILIISAPILLIAVLIAVLGNVSQQKWMITAKPLQPKFSKLSPKSGFKRIFSAKQLFQLLKSIAMIAIIIFVVYTTVRDEVTVLFTFYDISLNTALSITGTIITDLGIRISMIFVVIGLVDLFYERRKFKNDTMMTKQEIKDEFKNTEGDPQVKGQIRRKMQEASRRRMMQALPEADVVITNPTHFAVALKYEANAGKAPVVVAKGADYLAFQIKDKAKEYKIEIVENKPLARLLYNNVELGDEIPAELYQAVAEVLAFVYALKQEIG